MAKKDSSGGEERCRWTAVAGARGQGKMSAKQMMVELIQWWTKASVGSIRGQQQVDARACSPGALATRSARPQSARHNARGS